MLIIIGYSMIYYVYGRKRPMMAAFGEFGRKRREAVADMTTKFLGIKPRKPQSGYAQF
jgi:hypothetical protein